MKRKDALKELIDVYLDKVIPEGQIHEWANVLLENPDANLYLDPETWLHELQAYVSHDSQLRNRFKGDYLTFEDLEIMTSDLGHRLSKLFGEHIKRKVFSVTMWQSRGGYFRIIFRIDRTDSSARKKHRRSRE